MNTRCKICDDDFMFERPDNMGTIRNPFKVPKDIDICFSCLDKMKKWGIVDDGQIYSRAKIMFRYGVYFESLSLSKKVVILDSLEDGTLKISNLDINLLR